MLILKIVIFEPHPDDLLMGPGPIILKWIEEKHDIHIITVTDGRACFRKSDEKDIVEIPEDEVAEMRINEAKETIEFLGLPQENLHLLYFPDAECQKYIKEGIEKVKPLIRDAERLCLPSNHNLHDDHQATHDIAVGAARELNLTNIEYWVYFVPQYGRFNEDSKDKRVTIKISEDEKQKLQEWLEIYQSQSITKLTWKLYTRYIKSVKQMLYAIFKFEDIGKYHNF